MSNGHQVIYKELSAILSKDKIRTVLDAGSGKTSLVLILSGFKNAVVDAVVYPGDIRKINSIFENIPYSDNYRLIECDLCKEKVQKNYDLVIVYLLLGEATKFGGNTFEGLFTKLMSINFKYLILIDYLEDTAVDYPYIERYVESHQFNIIKKTKVENKEPQHFDDFNGNHNIGYLIQKFI